MFTGIIEATAAVLTKDDSSLTLERPRLFTDTKLGDSIAVAGVCLTVSVMSDDQLVFDVVPETWRCTRLGGIAVGHQLNLERAMPANGRFDGHLVQGHVEDVATVVDRVQDGEDVRLTIAVPDDCREYVIHKGCITIDGVSLTVAEREDNRCTVALVPYTLDHTTLGALEVDDQVNLETDIVGRYVQAMIPPRSV